MLTLELVNVGLPDARLVAKLSGMDVLWCCQSQVSVPLSAITEVETPAPEASQYLLKGLRVGTHLPGFVAKGNWYWFGSRMFVYLFGTDRAEKSIGIGMRRSASQPFTRWILEVPEGSTPQEWKQRIIDAISKQ